LKWHAKKRKIKFGKRLARSEGEKAIQGSLSNLKIIAKKDASENKKLLMCTCIFSTGHLLK
jgi:hypothetical protein